MRDPVHIMDILPTIGAAAQAQYPRVYDGRDIMPCEGVNLLPVCDGQSLAPRALAFEHQASRALRYGRWKVVWSKRMPYDIDWELYDLQTDRCETTNLAAQYPQRVQAMAETWMAWAKAVKVYPFFKPPTP